MSVCPICNGSDTCQVDEVLVICRAAKKSKPVFAVGAGFGSL
jgi:hypothetical protein